MQKRWYLLSMCGMLLASIACGPLTFLQQVNNDGISSDVSEQIAIGETRTASSTDILEIHDWTFDASANQEFAIRAEAIGGSDPRLQIVDQQGNILVENDDFDTGGDRSAQVRFFVPEDDTYTARVDFFATGDYSLSIEDITPLTAPTE